MTGQARIIASDYAQSVCQAKAALVYSELERLTEPSWRDTQDSAETLVKWLWSANPVAFAA